jgi:hypothetical protein
VPNFHTLISQFFPEQMKRSPLAAIIAPSMQPTQTEAIFEQLEWLPLLVHVTVVLFLTLWWIFRRVNGRLPSMLFECFGMLMQVSSHMNVDYSICNAINHRSGFDTSLIIYDVGCQWCIHFAERVANCPGLTIPKQRRVLAAVGKFHLSAHKLPCFARFSLNFIEGAGQVDGEILETLWATFNKISPTARSMSQGHRQEILDDHMRDSNWKKLVQIGKYLLVDCPSRNSVYSKQ